jgi:tetraacyldisaccharide 4'-kinase
VETGLGRADVVLSIGDEVAQSSFRERWADQVPCPIVSGILEPLKTGMDWSDLRAVAFAGIGRPEKFFRTLRELGADVVRAEALSDHQELTPALMKRLEIEAQTAGARLVTTEKDAVRLPASFRMKVLTLPVRLRLEGGGALESALRRTLS